jgi:SAM-dependent methyltransferase
VDERFAVNRANWDERTAIHLGSRFYDVEGWLREERGPRAFEAEVLGDVAGLRLLHLQCHFGLDTLAWARAGARVTGLDFSTEAIDAARDLAVRAGLDGLATFVCADVLDAVDALDHATFDVVYVSIGSLTWLPSVDRWARQVGALVAPGGRLYVHDVHPFGLTLAFDESRVERTYFEEPDSHISESGITYADGSQRLERRRAYWWNHGIGETVTALVRHGLRLEWLTEHDWTLFEQFPWLVERDGRWVHPPSAPRIPLTFSMLATRPE